MSAPFRPKYSLAYFGSKLRAVERVVSLARQHRAQLFVEPFAGSAVCSLNAAHHLGIDWVGFDVDERIVALHRWLGSTTRDEVVALLDEHDRRLGDIEKVQKSGGDVYVGFDIRDARYPHGFEVAMRLASASLLGTMHIHRMRRKPTRRWLDSLPAWARGAVALGGYERASAFDVEGAFFLLDPPYVGTVADYSSGADGAQERQGGGFDLARFVSWACSLRSPRVITYGADAPDVMPGFEWQPLFTRGGSAVLTGERTGSSSEEARREWYTVLPGTW